MSRPTVTATALAAFLTALGGFAIGASGSSPTGFAVVELFTSEGCSSCPPAEALLGRLSKEARSDGSSVFLLAFHVDYWDRLGWKDRFSDPAFSARQEEYARVLGEEGLYTPQMIVNGREEFLGSDESRARRSIASALARPAAAEVRLKPEAIQGRSLPVDFAVAGAAAPAVLHLVLVEGSLSVQVARGENAGRKLDHEEVVRSFQTIPLKDSGSGRAEIPVPESVVLAHGSLIGFVQDPRTRAILGAAAVDLAPAVR